MTRYLLDTCICIDIIRGRSAHALKRLRRECEVGDVAISSITLAELFHGVQKSAKPEENEHHVRMFCAPIDILAFDVDAALHYGDIRAELERNGNVIGPIDLFIAAHARSIGVCLVTSNEREFRRVPDLVVENWACD